MKRTSTQNRQLHALFLQAGLLAQKEALVYNFTGQRTGSSAEMSYYEANNLIVFLKKEVEKRVGRSVGRAVHLAANAQFAHAASSTDWAQCNRLRRALIAQSYSIGEGVSFVKGWCEKMGVNGGKKNFNKYTAHELRGLLEKFKRVVEHRVQSVVNE